MVWEEQNVCLSINFLGTQGERVSRGEAPAPGLACTAPSTSETQQPGTKPTGQAPCAARGKLR